MESIELFGMCLCDAKSRRSKLDSDTYCLDAILFVLPFQRSRYFIVLWMHVFSRPKFELIKQKVFFDKAYFKRWNSGVKKSRNMANIRDRCNGANVSRAHENISRWIINTYELKNVGDMNLHSVWIKINAEEFSLSAREHLLPVDKSALTLPPYVHCMQPSENFFITLPSRLSTYTYFLPFFRFEFHFFV